MSDSCPHNLNNPEKQPPREKSPGEHLYVAETVVMNWVYTKVGYTESENGEAREESLNSAIPWGVRMIKVYQEKS